MDKFILQQTMERQMMELQNMQRHQEEELQQLMLQFKYQQEQMIERHKEELFSIASSMSNQ